MNNVISATALVIIALAQASQAVAIYGADGGGYNACMGNFCYHIAQGESGL